MLFRQVVSRQLAKSQQPQRTWKPYQKPMRRPSSSKNTLFECAIASVKFMYFSVAHTSASCPRRDDIFFQRGNRDRRLDRRARDVPIPKSNLLIGRRSECGLCSGRRPPTRSVISPQRLNLPLLAPLDHQKWRCLPLEEIRKGRNSTGNAKHTLRVRAVDFAPPGAARNWHGKQRHPSEVRETDFAAFFTKPPFGPRLPPNKSHGANTYPHPVLAVQPSFTDRFL